MHHAGRDTLIASEYAFAANFHGSTGYGQGFCDSIRGDWGGKPFEDCMAAVDYILAKHAYLDPGTAPACPLRLLGTCHR